LNWFVYMIRCSDNSLYTGITTDVDRRFRQHLGGKGAKYFRGRSPLQIVYREENHSRCSAAGREYLIKNMDRTEKEFMVAEFTIKNMRKTPVVKNPSTCNPEPGSGSDAPPC